MYNSFDNNLAELAYLIERISIVTKEFLNHLNKKDDTFTLISKIYKSTQSINYEFIKLCYNIRSDENLSINLSGINSITIPVNRIKNINEFKNFINCSNNTLREPVKFICQSANNYSRKLSNEFIYYTNLIDDLNKKIADDI
ncbi:MAG: hypothetical protein E7213_03280 [Clostridium sp.]|nr:hypothetical protein [Clostridium sp.]